MCHFSKMGFVTKSGIFFHIFNTHHKNAMPKKVLEICLLSDQIWMSTKTNTLKNCYCPNNTLSQNIGSSSMDINNIFDSE